MRSSLLCCVLLGAAFAFTAQASPLIGGPKTIAVGADGTVPGLVASAQMGQGGYVSGATKVAVPLIAVAFETSAQARMSNGFGSKSLALRLEVSDAVMKEITAELQSMVEADLAAQGFEILPKDSIDAEPKWLGIRKNGVIGEDVKDNFMSGFMGNGSMNRWYTAGDRPLFGTGATAALSELSPLIRTAREKQISLLFYRFKVQFTDLEGKNGLVFNYVKGKNVLRIVSADMSVFTPTHTLGALVKLNANVTAGSDFVQDLVGSPGSYVVTADPVAYKADSLRLIHAVSMQFAQALRKAQ
ncbi:MAG: hypothetical protein EOP93_18235 [Lysobacteraceae bacterium]|nr:MAG: hypothetical protein EOP93_18235 [Xanthomonadaceae bacterium]